MTSVMPVEHRRGELVGERLAAAGRRDDQHATGLAEQRVDRLALPRSERVEAEPGAERLLDRIEGALSHRVFRHRAAGELIP